MSSRVIAIVGPTASGKSSLADKVALSLGTSVVSIDAMQVYRGMDIGTAKTPAEERSVDLLMVDRCDPTDDYSAQVFQRDARACVDGLLESRNAAVLCGGTGLYLDAVIDEMDFPQGKIDDEARKRYGAILAEHDANYLYELLRKRDERSAQLIHPNNTRRVIRALEMLDEGVSYAANHEGLKNRAPHYAAKIYAISMDRKRLYKRIDLRVDKMMELGLVAEVERLVQHGLSTSSTARQAIGYKEILDYLDGSCTLDEAVETIKQRSRRYAKRQISWIKRDGRAMVLDYDAISEDRALDIVLAGISS